MSKQGVKIAAEVFSFMQEKRQELLRLGSAQASTNSGKQDILLGQMLEDGKESIKERFCELVMLKTEENGA